MGVSCRKEFQCSHFCFYYTKPYKFIRPQWRISLEVYVVWRLFWAFWHTAWLTYGIQESIADALYEGAGIKWLIYLTNLTYLIQTVQSCLHLGVICYVYVAKKEDAVEESIQWYLKALWLLTTLQFDAAIMVTGLYWTLVFEGEIESFLSVATHAINTVYAVIDIFVIAAPVRLLHLIYPAMYGMTYITFTVVYHMFNGTNSDSEPYIYKSLDWSKPVSSAIISLLSAFVALPAVHVLQFGLYLLRLHIIETSKCCGKCANQDQDILFSLPMWGGETPRVAEMTEAARSGVVQTIVQIDPRDKVVITSPAVGLPHVTIV